MARVKDKIGGKDALAAWIRDRRAASEDSLSAGMEAGWVWSMTAFAAQVGVSRQMVRHWVQGIAKPNQEHRALLQRATGGQVQVRFWD